MAKRKRILLRGGTLVTMNPKRHVGLGDLGRLVWGALVGASVYALAILIMAPGLLRTASQAIRVMLTPSST